MGLKAAQELRKHRKDEAVCTLANLRCRLQGELQKLTKSAQSPTSKKSALKVSITLFHPPISCSFRKKDKWVPVARNTGNRKAISFFGRRVTKAQQQHQRQTFTLAHEYTPSLICFVVMFIISLLPCYFLSLFFSCQQLFWHRFSREAEGEPLTGGKECHSLSRHTANEVTEPSYEHGTATKYQWMQDVA